MLLVVPGPDPEPWPTLGPEICDFIEERAVYGPGSLAGQPYVIDAEFRAFLYRAYEVYPRGHQWAGRRRFKRVGMSIRKGLAKTERMAIVTEVELHPEAPARADGWHKIDGLWEPVGRPVRSPYIPMLASTEEQVEDLAYAVLKYIIENGPDADLFDISLERIIRLDDRGRADGKAAPMAGAPGARDGALTTLNCYDEPHRMILPRALAAHTTMEANLAKRPLEDPWSLYVGTAGQAGQGSVAELVHREAEAINEGKVERPDLFYLYRTDDDPHRDLADRAQRIRAITEATGPAGEWGPGQFDDIASQWDRPGADKPYLERVWLNRWVKQGDQFFDPKLVDARATPGIVIPPDAFVTLGFDGAVFRDATALVATEIRTGLQELLGLWEKPEGDEDWEVPVDEVDALLRDTYRRLDVWKLYGDPQYWIEQLAKWAARFPGRVEEYWTNRPKTMAYGHRSYTDAIAAGSVSFGGNDEGRADFRPHADLLRHLRNAGKHELKIRDDEGKPLYVMRKQDGREDLKFDAAMAGSLSWIARVDAIKKRAKPRRGRKRVVRRLR